MIKKTKEDDRGYVLVPYVMADHTPESLRDYEEFMSGYRARHEVCPECGDKAHTTTLMGYVLYADRRDEYKDLNRCVCEGCGSHHVKHDRISAEEFDSRKNKEE